MAKHIRLLLVAAVALIALGAAVSTANAAEATLEPAGVNINAISLGLVTFNSSFISTTCRVTLLFRLLRGPIAKTAGNQIGTLTRITAGECNEGITALILRAQNEAGAAEQTVALTMKYQSITGTLPSNVTSVLFTVERPLFLLTIPSIFGTQHCLFEGAEQGATLEVAGRNPYTSGLVRMLRTPSRLTTAATLNTGLCPSTGELQGSFGTSEVIRLTRT